MGDKIESRRRLHAYQSGEGWQKEEHVEAKQYITVYTI